jgi:hypothetical protein
VHQEVPKEEAAVETIRAVEDWCGEWHLALGHRWQLEKRTQGDGGSRKKLAATRRWMTHCAVTARRKAHSHKEETMEGPGMQKLSIGPRCKTAGTSEEGEDIQQDLQEDHRAGDWKSNSQVFDWATGRSEWLDIVEGLAFSNTNEEVSKAQPSEKKGNGGTPGPPGTLSGNCMGHGALRRQQWE